MFLADKEYGSTHAVVSWVLKPTRFVAMFGPIKSLLADRPHHSPCSVTV
jgi:hypothetical protein